VFILLGGLACGGEPDTRIAEETVGGVPTVSNAAVGLLGDTVPWELTEYLLVAGDQLYDRKPAVLSVDVGILPNGNVVVLDLGYRRVLRFGPDGAYLGSFGGRGEEPGQFATPLFLDVAGERIYVLDTALNRVTEFDTSGIFLSRFQIDRNGLAGGAPLFAAGGPDEIYLAAEPVPFFDEVRDTGRAVIYRYDRSGAIVDTAAAFPASPWTELENEEGESVYFKHRLAPEPRISANAGSVAVNVSARYQIEIHQPDGRPVRRITRVYQSVPVSDAIRDSTLAVESQVLGTAPREILEMVSFAPVVQAIKSLVLDDRGRVWVEAYQDDPRRRDIFDERGRYLGPLYLPQPFALTDVSGDRACGVLTLLAEQTAAVCYRILQ
jgi:DNA-binding beta-propeller fold protein YncE